MSNFLNSHLQKLEAYTPGEQPRDKQYIKLNTNESPFPPSPGVIAAITAEQIADLRLYCDPECKQLRQALARLCCVEPENIFLSNGSDDILNFAFLAYGQDGVAFADISYGFYPVYAQLHGLTPQVIPLLDDFSLDVEAFCGVEKMVVIANPNAPTGLQISLEQIQQILESNSNHVVVIDEAYIAFGGTSCLELTRRYKNLLCVRTFSKSHSMAGARLGYAIGHKDLICDLKTIQYSTNPYNINRLTQIAGAKAIEENDYYLKNCEKIIENREYTVRGLEALGFTVLPSKANFIFAKSPRIDGLALYQKLKEQGILIRHFEKPRIRDFNRITIGSREEMEQLLAKVAELLGGSL